MIKPINLNYFGTTDALEENNLVKLVCDKKLTDFELGMKMFNQLEPQDHYAHLYWKIEWLDTLVDCAFTDPRYVTKIRPELQNIIENCTFDDLIVKAKLVFCETTFRADEKREYCIELLMGCLENHYGRLPLIFAFLVRYLKRYLFSM